MSKKSVWIGVASVVFAAAGATWAADGDAGKPTPGAQGSAPESGAARSGDSSSGASPGLRLDEHLDRNRSNARRDDNATKDDEANPNGTDADDLGARNGATPAVPATPAVSANPASPFTPANPAMPGTPATPATPGDPGNPVTPTSARS